jgi:pimeloyl-ACP methyl ester carboxylesterase
VPAPPTTFERNLMPVVDLDDVRLFYTDEGSGPPVLLVHGWSCDSHDWSWQIPALTADHRVLAVDLRGHGRSSVPADGYEPRVFARDLAGLLERLDVGPVLAVGHSLGGAVVTTLAVEHPELVAAVVAVDPAYGIEAEMLPMIEMLTTAMADDALGAAAAMFAMFYTDETPAHLRTWHLRRLLGDPPHVIHAVIANLYMGPDAWTARPEADAYVARRACPSFAVYADEARAACDRTAITEPGRVEVWEGAGHFMHQERPEQFNETLRRWIAEVGPW